MSCSQVPLIKSPQKKLCVVTSCHISNNNVTKPHIMLHKGELRASMPKKPTLRNAHGMLGTDTTNQVCQSNHQSYIRTVRDCDLEG
jgi:hypothetical protein